MTAWLIVLGVYSVVITTLLVIALGGNSSIVRELRALRGENARLHDQARRGLVVVPGGRARPRRPVVAATGREVRR